MAEEKGEGKPEEDKAAKPKASSKNLILIIGIVVLALAGGIGAYFLFAGNKGAKTETKKEEEKKKDGKTALVALDSFILNLAEHGRFLKMTMQMELADTSYQPLYAEKSPQIRDAIITLVSSKSAEAVASPEGKMLLKDELLLRANQSVGKDIFKNLYFTEFVMQ